MAKIGTIRSNPGSPGSKKANELFIDTYLVQKEKGMVIGVDLDGVVYDFVEVFARWIHREKNIPLSQMLPPPT